MSSFATDILSREQGLSAELYTFTFTSGAIQRYTSFERDILPGDFDGVNTYTHMPITRSEFEVDDALSSTRMKITAPAINLWANMGIQNGQIAVKVLKVFLADKTSQTVFSGLVLSITKMTGQGEAECASKMYYLEKELPRVFFQSSCNNTLFDSKCTMIAANYQYSLLATVSNNGYTLTIDETAYTNFVSDFVTKHGFTPPLAGTPRKSLWTLGQCSYAGESRYITNHTSRILQLHYPFSDLTSGVVAVTLLPGCDKTGDYCLNVFGTQPTPGNILNFTGMPYMPAADPTVQAVAQ